MLAPFAMILSLVAIIVLLIALIVYLNVQFYHEKRRFKARLAVLHEIIGRITERQDGQRGRIQLSDELNQKLKASQATLGQDLFALNYELFDTLSKNNLLKK